MLNFDASQQLVLSIATSVTVDQRQIVTRRYTHLLRCRARERWAQVPCSDAECKRPISAVVIQLPREVHAHVSVGVDDKWWQRPRPIHGIDHTAQIVAEFIHQQRIDRVYIWINCLHTQHCLIEWM